MHIPDGFLSAPVCITLGASSLVLCTYSFLKIKKNLSSKLIPWMGSMGAFIFACQMINIPVAGGTSTHLLGSAVAAILLGKEAGFCALTMVIFCQCILFQDGGLISLGANIFNMAGVGCFGGWLIFTLFMKLTSNRKISTFLAGWLSLILSSIFVSIELSFSGTIPLKVVLPAMTIFHTFAGILEGVVSYALVEFVYKMRPDLLNLSMKIPQASSGG